MLGITGHLDIFAGQVILKGKWNLNHPQCLQTQHFGNRSLAWDLEAWQVTSSDCGHGIDAKKTCGCDPVCTHWQMTNQWSVVVYRHFQSRSPYSKVKLIWPYYCFCWAQSWQTPGQKKTDKNPRTACLAARPAPLRQKKVHLLQGMLPTCLIQGFLMWTKQRVTYLVFLGISLQDWKPEHATMCVLHISRLPYSKFCLTPSFSPAPLPLCCDRVDWNMKQEECESCFAWLKVGCRVHLTRKPWIPVGLFDLRSRNCLQWDSLPLFPTCQVRVVRFYQSCSSASSSFSSSSASSSSSSSSFSSTMSVSTSTSTSALPTLRQSLRQLPRAVGTAGPQLPVSDHGWTSTARFWAQWAPLDLNQGPSEPSGHRWTSTWDLPSSVGTAGPQPGTFRAQWAPLDLNGQIECQKMCQIERQIECQIEC